MFGAAIIRRSSQTILFLAVCLFPSTAFATVYYVPDDFGTVQAALDGASNGDTIIVRDGIYTGPENRELDFKGKALTLRSENGAGNCIIDCEDQGKGFYFHNSEGNDSVLDGFTITGGHGDEYGGGISCEGASPTIVNCIITDNYSGGWCEEIWGCSGWGGGIYCSDASPIISNCTISSNISFEGAGIAAYRSSPTITGCLIARNRASVLSAMMNWTGYGGGISGSSANVSDCIIASNYAADSGGGVFGSSSTITDSIIIQNEAFYGGGGGIYSRSDEIRGNIIINNTAREGGGIWYIGVDPSEISGNTLKGNTARDGGGGIYYMGGQLQLSDNTISGNFAGANGGGIDCQWGYSPGMPIISGNTIRGNSAAGNGGGINCLNGPSPTITNNFIIGNVAGMNGGGISSFCYSAASIIHSTISGNLAGISGGGLYCSDASSMTAVDSILWGNVGKAGSQVSVESGASSATLSISYCDVEKGQAGAYVGSGSSLTWGPGNINVNPQFVGGGNYHLKNSSPCIDAGADAGVYTDVDGNPRPLGGGFDMGADEYGELSQINLTNPPNESIQISPPTFEWLDNGGTNNAFIVEMSLSISEPFRAMSIVFAPSWAISASIWSQIPSGSYVYWRVRGADLARTPFAVIYSEDIWWFYKP